MSFGKLGLSFNSCEALHKPGVMFLDARYLQIVCERCFFSQGFTACLLLLWQFLVK